MIKKINPKKDIAKPDDAITCEVLVDAIKPRINKINPIKKRTIMALFNAFPELCFTSVLKVLTADDRDFEEGVGISFVPDIGEDVRTFLMSINIEAVMMSATPIRKRNAPTSPYCGKYTNGMLKIKDTPPISRSIVFLDIN